MEKADNTQVATLATGCFWCTEAIFNQLRGVLQVVSGYSGGSVDEPTYEQVCSGETDHAEAIQVTFDPSIISYEELLYVFWRSHNPTTLNQQGNDLGTQYRSAIFYHSDEQKLAAIKSKADIETQGLYPDPVVTEITPFTNFFAAEKFHQDFYKNNPNQPYCKYVIDPKLQKLKKEFKHLLKE